MGQTSSKNQRVLRDISPLQFDKLKQHSKSPQPLPRAVDQKDIVEAIFFSAKQEGSMYNADTNIFLSSRPLVYRPMIN